MVRMDQGELLRLGRQVEGARHTAGPTSAGMWALGRVGKRDIWRTDLKV